MRTIIITYAVDKEFTPFQIDGWDINYIITGVGKAMSAMKLTKAICDIKPEFVINIGTAGTLVHNIGDIFICRKFVDRDYQQTKLPGLEYEIDFTEREINDAFPERLINAKENKIGTCNTGDTFVTQSAGFNEDVVDMESYAQALVCKEFNIPFIAVKYVTDIIGKNSVKHWEDKLADAREVLTEWTKNTLRVI